MCLFRSSLHYWIFKKDLGDYTQDDLSIFLFHLFCMCLCLYLEVPYVIGYLRRLRRLHKAYRRVS
jgi:hypothetical protein